MKTTGLQRDPLDAFFTIPSVASSCIQQFLQHVQPTEKDILIEPSAGSGSFSNLLQDQFATVYAFDIDPQSEHVLQQDFLQFPETDLFQQIVSSSFPIHVIGNPPFGRQSKLARLFIKICSKFATSISFILPKSFKKTSFQQTFPLLFHLQFQMDLPPFSFQIQEQSHHVPCVFQVWKKASMERTIPRSLEPTGFIFCKKQENPDFAIRRVGVYAGKLIITSSSLSEQSHYFVRLTGMKKKDFQEKMKHVVFEHDNTVGPRSISKQEILEKLL